MLASAIPAKIQVPFATTGDKVTIPVPSQIGIVDGRASWTTGFVPLNGTPLSAGGVAPFETDFNGIFNQITAIQQWQSAGGIFKYDSDFSTAIGGYPKGCVLAKANNSGSWFNLADNNTTNPDSVGSANWIDNVAGRLLNVVVITSNGTYTPSPAMQSVIVEAQGGGGAGGSCAATSGTQFAIAGGGGSGSYSKGRFTAAQIGASQAVTIGAAGASSAAGANVGGTGGATSMGVLITAPGGTGGTGGGALTSGSIMTPGATPSLPGIGGNIFAVPGTPGGMGISLSGSLSGAGGGAPIYGGAGGGAAGGAGSSGSVAAARGAGGGGAFSNISESAKIGGTGGPGVMIIWEFS